MFEDKTIMLPVLSKKKFDESQLEKLHKLADKIHKRRKKKIVNEKERSEFRGLLTVFIGICSRENMKREFKIGDRVIRLLK